MEVIIVQTKKDEITAEIRRIAENLGKDYITEREFNANSKMGISLVKYNFGSWNRAIEAAGLNLNIGFIPEKETISEDELLQEIIRLTKELGKIPSDREMNAFGKYSVNPYRRVWGKYTKGREAAYLKYGFPDIINKNSKNKISNSTFKDKGSQESTISPSKIKIKKIKVRKKVQFGAPIAFRGLRFAPINEQGVVFLFGIISRELGFLIESIRTEFPDSEGKRCVNEKKNLWEHVLIEFEYKSSNFKEHGHNPDECDLIICWIHDWEDCPIEVIELKSTINYLSNK